MILTAEHLSSETPDVPCTYALNFRIRENKLNMTVHMRSQDAIFGMGNDAPTFSFIQEMIYVTLRSTYPDLVMGNYHHFVDSLHVYEKHFSMLEEIINNPIEFESIDCPRIFSEDEVDYLRKTDFSKSSHTSRVHYNFTDWLLSK